jgi:histone H3/H4
MIIKKSEVKALVGDEYRISQDFYEKLSDSVEEFVKAAMARAKENGRKTLKPYDL